MREAIEKKAGDDGVVVLNGQFGGEDVGLLKVDLRGGATEAVFRPREHGRAEIETVDLRVWGDGDEFGQATAVAFPENEDAATLL